MRKCAVLGHLFIGAALLATVHPDMVVAQQLPGGMVVPRPAVSSTPVRPVQRKVVRPNPPPPGEYLVEAEKQEVDGAFYRLRGKASIESEDLRIEADEIDYNTETKIAEARGSVYFQSFEQGEQVWADRAEYSFNEKRGSFYNVKGSAPGKIDPRPGILTTGNPFLFRGDWAEKLDNRYLLYQGTLTNCTYPDPWWVLTAPKFDIIPGDRAIAYKSLFKLKGVPLLWTPAFYKSLSDETRRSGFLTPNFGSSNRRGFMYGLGYYWAVNRSYDVSYRAQYFTKRGFAHTADFRGKPTQKSDFDVYVYGVDDKGLLLSDGTRRKEGGVLATFTGKSEWGKGFYSRGVVNYLSDFKFRQAFTESFNEAVYSEVNSIFFTSKNWSTYHFNAVFTQQDNYQSDKPGDKIEIRRLPSIEFSSRDREVTKKESPIPVWFSFNSSMGLVRRTQPLFQTRRFVERLNLEPRISTALRWKEIHLIPWTSVRETYYGSSFQDGQVAGTNYNRFSREVGAELVLPSLSRVFSAPSWTKARQLKHSIEPRATFRHVAGVSEFERAIRFDEMELVANTTEVEISVANRFWKKNRAGEVSDFLIWEVSQRRFFDTDFGGAVRQGQRNIVLSSSQMTAFAFLNEPRSYSPVVSVLRAQPRPAFGLEWRTDYDPLRNKMTNSSFSADARLDNYFFSFGHNKVSCIPLIKPGQPAMDPCTGIPAQGTVLSPPSNQVRGMIGLGQENRRGWNAGFLAVYDYSQSFLQYANSQLTYNTNCCAYSFQYRRFAFGGRNENQFRLAFVIANIGSFGTLRRQERLF